MEWSELGVFCLLLQGANMQIRRGEAVGIIGGSGTGKSTTLRIMAGLLTPDKVGWTPLNQLKRDIHKRFHKLGHELRTP